MSEDFLGNTGSTPPPAASNPDNEPSPRREPIKMLLIGSPESINHTIRNLFKREFAEVGAWSPLLPTKKPGEFMSILSRQIWID
jgi:hypothetical protein